MTSPAGPGLEATAQIRAEGLQLCTAEEEGGVRLRTLKTCPAPFPANEATGAQAASYPP